MCSLRPLKAYRPVFAPSDVGYPAPSPVLEEGSDVRLRLVADMVETVAYDIATSQPAEVVSRLIVIAADLENLAEMIERDRL